MEAAKNGLERIVTAGEKIREVMSNGKAGAISQEEEKLLNDAKVFVTKFEDAMDDDCNTANAITAVFELVKFSNSNLGDNSSKKFCQVII